MDLVGTESWTQTGEVAMKRLVRPPRALIVPRGICWNERVTAGQLWRIEANRSAAFPLGFKGLKEVGFLSRKSLLPQVKKQGSSFAYKKGRPRARKLD